MATHSSILTWRIQVTWRLQSMGSQRVQHNWATKHSTAQHSDPHTQPGLRAVHLWLWFSILRNGNNTEMQTLGPYPRPAQSDTLGWGPVICVFPCPPGDQNLWALQERRKRSFQESKCFESSLSQKRGTPTPTGPLDGPPWERSMVSHSILSLRQLRHGAASGVPSTLWSWFWLSSVFWIEVSAISWGLHGQRACALPAPPSPDLPHG